MTILDVKNKLGVKTKDAKTILEIYLKLKLATIEEAYEVFLYDQAIDKSPKPIEGEVTVEKPKAAKKGGIQQNELDQMKVILTTLYQNGQTFKNADLNSLREELSLTARQTPSRLKRLVEAGFLEDVGGSPKSYKIKE